MMFIRLCGMDLHKLKGLFHQGQVISEWTIRFVEKPATLVCGVNKSTIFLFPLLYIFVQSVDLYSLSNTFQEGESRGSLPTCHCPNASIW